MPLYRYDVIFVQAGRDKATLRRNLLELRRKYPDARFVLMLENLGISDLTFGHRMGMSAFVDERATADQIVSSIEAAARGDLYASNSVIRRSLSQPPAGEEPPSEPESPGALSQREIEVLNLVARGMSNRLIARNLFISEKTVKNHITNILDKLFLENRSQVVAYAYRNKLVESCCDGIPRGRRCSVSRRFILLRSLRIKKSLSRKVLAERVSISGSHLGRVERGECRSSIRLLSRLAKELGVPVEKLAAKRKK